MYTEKKRAELADICYMTIEKECSKPIEEINTALIDAGLDLAGKLLNIQPLSDDEVSSAKKTIIAMTLRRRKKLKIRIIAAVLVILVVLVTTACAFSDWLLGIFGRNNLHNVPPGYSVTVDQHELEAPSDMLCFDSIEDLVGYVDEPIYLPMGLSEKFVLNGINMYEFQDERIEVLWIKESHTIRYKITLNPSYFNEKQFNAEEYDYYTKDGIPINYVYLDPYWQAVTWVNNNEYVISADNKEILKEIIDCMVVLE